MANSPQLETNQDSIVLKLIMMKTLKIMLMMLLAAAALSCEKSGPENPPVPEVNTLDVDKTDISLCYLERDTINVPGVDAGSVQWGIAEGGDGIITLLGNIVVGRRKGEATVVASYNGEAAAIKVTVTTENYIPVEKLIWEVNGQRVESMDDESLVPTVGKPFYYPPAGPIYPTFANDDVYKIVRGERMDVKFIGYEPADASCPILSKVEERSWYKIPDIKKQSGNLNDLEDFSTTTQNINGNDETEDFIYYMHPFPPDLEATEWDMEQMSAAYRSDKSESEYRNANKFLRFAVSEPDIKDITGEKSLEKPFYSDFKAGIYLKSGESKRVEDELTIKPFALRELQHTYQFVLGNLTMHDGTWSIYLADAAATPVNKRHRGKLHLSEEGVLSLDTDFSMDDIYEAIESGDCNVADYTTFGTGIMDDLEIADTLNIGTLSILLLPPDGIYYQSVLDEYGEVIAEGMSRAGNEVDVFWVRE